MVMPCCGTAICYLLLPAVWLCLCLCFIRRNFNSFGHAKTLICHIFFITKLIPFPQKVRLNLKTGTSVSSKHQATVRDTQTHKRWHCRRLLSLKLKSAAALQIRYCFNTIFIQTCLFFYKTTFIISQIKPHL